jgi:hypothetical protein
MKREREFRWAFCLVVVLGLCHPLFAGGGAAFAPPPMDLPSPLFGIDAAAPSFEQQFHRDSLDLPQALTTLKPKTDDANGLSIEGNVSFTYNYTGNSGTLRLLVDRVNNANATRTSGTLRLVVWFTASPFPSYGYRTAIYTLGQLQPNYYYYDIDSGTISFSTPPTNCYYATVVLEEWSGSEWLYADYVETTPRQGINTTCNVTQPPPPPPPGNCTADATTLCMLNNRFRVRVRYRNQFSNPAQTGYLRGRSFETSTTAESSVFWFSDAKNVEYLVKLYDVRPFEQKIHLASGAVTDIETWLEVTDTKYNVTRSYNKGPGSVNGTFDRTSFNP